MLKDIGREFLITLTIMQMRDIYQVISDIFNYKSHMTFLGMTKEFGSKVKNEKILVVSKKDIKIPSNK